MVKNYQGSPNMAQKKLTQSIIKIVRDYGKIVAKSIPVEQVIIFGSYAKGNIHKDSDIDVCVVSSKFGKDLFEESIVLDRFTDNVDSRIEAHPMTQKLLSNKYDTLASEIREHGIAISL